LMAAARIDARTDASHKREDNRRQQQTILHVAAQLRQAEDPRPVKF
jgi:hypothetical protein